MKPKYKLIVIKTTRGKTYKTKQIRYEQLFQVYSLLF